jgi:hypothetical protein
VEELCGDNAQNMERHLRLACIKGGLHPVVTCSEQGLFLVSGSLVSMGVMASVRNFIGQSSKSRQHSEVSQPVTFKRNFDLLERRNLECVSRTVSTGQESGQRCGLSAQYYLLLLTQGWPNYAVGADWAHGERGKVLCEPVTRHLATLLRPSLTPCLVDGSS